MNLKNVAVAAACAWAGTGFASTIAIIDSGVDIAHESLDGRIWQNTKEVQNRKDDDGNGFKDDIYGWNFFGNNNKVIDYKYDKYYDEDVATFFELQGKVLKGTITPDELEWLQGAVEDEEFVKQLTKFRYLFSWNSRCWDCCWR